SGRSCWTRPATPSASPRWPDRRLTAVSPGHGTGRAGGRGPPGPRARWTGRRSGEDPRREEAVAGRTLEDDLVPGAAAAFRRDPLLDVGRPGGVGVRAGVEGHQLLVGLHVGHVDEEVQAVH